MESAEVFELMSDEDILLKIEEGEKDVENIKKFQGYHTLLSMFDEAKDEQYTALPKSFETDVKFPTNDAILAMIISPKEAIRNVYSCLQANCVVAMILLILSSYFMVSPPNGIEILHHNHPAKLLFCLFWSLSSALSVFLLILTAQYTVAMNRSIRDSDKIRVLLFVDKYIGIDPTSLGVALMYLSLLFASIAVNIGQLMAYGVKSVAFTIIYFVIFAVALRIAFSYVFSGHVSYYWKDIGHKHDDPVDLRAAERLLTLKALMGSRILSSYRET